MAEVKGRSLWADARTRFLRNKAAMVSLVVLALVAAVRLLRPALSPWDNETIDWDVLGNVKDDGQALARQRPLLRLRRTRAATSSRASSRARRSA